MGEIMDKGTSKENVLVVGCKIDMIDKCVACSRCIKAFNDRDGEFTGLSPSAELIGLLDCGGCPGVAMGARLNEFKFWNQPPMGDLPTHVFIGNCITSKNKAGKYICPYAENIIETIHAKMEVDPVTGTDTTGKFHAHKGTHSKGKHNLHP
jgi:predicted metal-binding protein